MNQNPDETQNEGINKIMISPDGKESMIEKAVGDYCQAGFGKFVILTGFLGEKVEAHVGDGALG